MIHPRSRHHFGVAGILALAFLPAVFAHAADRGNQEDVTFRSGSATLAGTLVVPEGQGPHPAVVLISGSGPQDRNGSMRMFPGYAPFQLIADHLQRQGVAVLRYDDRGVGDSTGDYLDATEDDFVQDAAAALAFLRQRGDIDAGKVGLLGHSEGALIAALVAARDDRVAFVVSLGGPAVEGIKLLLQQARRSAEAEGMSEDEVAELLRDQERLFKLVLHEDWAEAERVVREITLKRIEKLPAWKKALLRDPRNIAAKKAAQAMEVFRSQRYRYLLSHNAAEDWAKVKAPVLALFAELDVQCDAAQNRAGLEEALRRGGNRKLTVHVLPCVNHLFLEAESGSMSEYATLPKEQLAPGVLKTISDWIHETVAAD
ncbi:MAG: alpha/beta fold hydrolase [Phycisphaerae bacterium]|jgi:pimeloyl-ACP methyl ester carboxylesterase